MKSALFSGIRPTRTFTIFAILASTVLSNAAAPRAFASQKDPLQIIFNVIPISSYAHIYFINESGEINIYRQEEYFITSDSSASHHNFKVADIIGSTPPGIPGVYYSVTAKAAPGYIAYYTVNDALAHGATLYRKKGVVGNNASIDTGSEIAEWLVLENGDVLVRNILDNNEEKLLLISGDTLKTKAEFTFPIDSNTAKTISFLSANNNGVFFAAGRTLYKLSSKDLSVSATFNTRDDITRAALDGDEIFLTTHRFNADVIGEFESSRLISVSAKDIRETSHFYTTMKILNIFPEGDNIIVEAFSYDTNKKHIVTLSRDDLSIKSEITPDAISFTTAFPAANSFLLYNENTLESLSPSSLSIRARIKLQGETIYGNGCALFALSSDRKTIARYDPAMLVQTASYNFRSPVDAIFGAAKIGETFTNESPPAAEPCDKTDPVYAAIDFTTYTLR